jgi:hypothetical protein
MLSTTSGAAPDFEQLKKLIELGMSRRVLCGDERPSGGSSRYSEKLVLFQMLHLRKSWRQDLGMTGSGRWSTCTCSLLRKATMCCLAY